MSNQRLSARLQQWLNREWNILIVGMWAVIIIVMLLVGVGVLSLFEGFQVGLTSSLVFVTMFYAQETYKTRLEFERERREAAKPILAPNVFATCEVQFVNYGAAARQISIEIDSGLGEPKETFLIAALGTGERRWIHNSKYLSKAIMNNSRVEFRLKYYDGHNRLYDELLPLDLSGLKNKDTQYLFPR